MEDIIVTQNRGYGYFLSVVLGVCCALLVTATVDAVKQTWFAPKTFQAIVR
jgi:hypothetical protein